MLTVVVTTAATAMLAGFVYLRREQLGFEGVGLAALRTIAIGALVLLLVNPGSSERQPGGSPVVLLDASLSMAVPGGKWEAAADSAQALAGTDGTVYRFGSDVAEFDRGIPTAGASRLSAALRSAIALGGPIHVVTDGELDDAGIVDPSFLESVSVVTLPRDTVADVALLDVDVPSRVSNGDSVRVVLTIGTWGEVSSPLASLEVSTGGRRVAIREIEIPNSPGVARRSLTFPPQLLPSGINVLNVRVQARNDAIPGDDERVRIVNVTEQPAIVVLLDPPDWEGRFLVSELGGIARTTVRGYAHVTPNSWIEMSSGLQLPEESVQRFAGDAALLLIRGSREGTTVAGLRQRVWSWPTIVDASPSVAHRDWYLSGTLQASPLADRLAFIQWDSLPPVLGLAQQPAETSGWVAISARQGRRGAERPVFTGHDSAGVRSLTTLGAGWWRWRLRGGAAREAYRAILAAGVDWLLGSERLRSDAPLISSTVVSRGEPTVFQWVRDSVPDSLAVSLLRDGDDDAAMHLARFDSRGTASLQLQPGTYRWIAPDAGGVRGVTVVEEYSDEYHPRMVADLAGGSPVGMTLLEHHARDNWWLFVIVVASLTVEWAWRHQRGLP
jgi:hypothetical protein